MNRNEKAEFEALKKSITVDDKVYFENKEKYFSLIKAFIDKTVDGIDFEAEFFKTYTIDFATSKTLEKDFLKLTTFQPDLKAEGFSDFISRLFTACDVFEPRPESREKYELSEEQLRDFVKKIFFEMQKYFDE